MILDLREVLCLAMSLGIDNFERATAVAQKCLRAGILPIRSDLTTAQTSFLYQGKEYLIANGMLFTVYNGEARYQGLFQGRLFREFIRASPPRIKRLKRVASHF